MLRQIDAFVRKFRWAFDQSAPSAFALVRRERRIEQKVDLGRGLLLDFRPPGPGSSGSSCGGWKDDALKPSSSSWRMASERTVLWASAQASTSEVNLCDSLTALIASHPARTAGLCFSLSRGTFF